MKGALLHLLTFPVACPFWKMSLCGSISLDTIDRQKFPLEEVKPIFRNKCFYEITFTAAYCLWGGHIVELWPFSMYSCVVVSLKPHRIYSDSSTSLHITFFFWRKGCNNLSHKTHGLSCKHTTKLERNASVHGLKNEPHKQMLYMKTTNCLKITI